MLMACPLVVNAEKICDLANRQQKGRPAHEAENDGFRDIASEIPELENSDENLNDTNHHAKQEHRFIGFNALTRFKKRQGAEDNKRDRAGRAIDKVGRGT